VASPPDLVQPATRFAPERTAEGSATLLNVLMLFSACSQKVPRWQGCQVLPEPTRDVSTSSAGRAAMSHPFSLPVLFHPGNTLELSPSRLRAAQRSDLVSESRPPLPFRAILRRRSRLRRVDPSAQRSQPSRSSTRHCLPGVLPSEALPPAAVAPTSRLLLSRASQARKPKLTNPLRLRVSTSSRPGFSSTLLWGKLTAPASLGFATSSQQNSRRGAPGFR